MYLLKHLSSQYSLFCIRYSHSTMYLLKLKIAVYNVKYTIFTFHHVSIKTSSKIFAYVFGRTFTFHHVSIKTRWLWSTERSSHIFTFHHVSIKTRQCTFYGCITMWFTFHHVSIKTMNHITPVWFCKYSHSTMYLLKLFSPLFLKHPPLGIHIPPCIY